MIRWAFLDVGNVLLDEDPLTFENFRVHVEAVRRARPDLTFARLLGEREERAVSGSAWPLHEVASRYLDEQGCIAAWDAAQGEIRGRYDDLSPPILGAEELLQALAPRFRLGLIANQGAECRRWLDRLGWLGRFEVIAFGEEEGLAKPDPALFLKALGRAAVDPDEAVMVGDRLDNDIAPASGLGMSTVWVRWPTRAAKGWTPSTSEGRDYVRSLERIAARLGDRAGVVEPSRTVDGLGGLVPALLSLDSSS